MENRRDNSGVLFKSDKKDNERAPDYKGNIMVDGQEYWLSAWIKISKDGNKFMSLSVKNKNADASLQPKKKVKQEEFEDTMPF